MTDQWQTTIEYVKIVKKKIFNIINKMKIREKYI